VFEAVKIDDVAMKERAQNEGLRRLHEDLGAAPRVWYRDLDRWETCFIGGSVSATIDGQVECVTDAKVTLLHDGVEIAQTTTDAFGDFQFKKLPKNSGLYEVEARHALGAASRRCKLGESEYLGEIRLDLPQCV
jgi:hypothetical protein